MHLSRPITCDDLVQVSEEWKLHSPDMFSAREHGFVDVSQNMRSLREEILGRVVTFSQYKSSL